MANIQQLYYKSGRNEEEAYANFAKGNSHDALQDTKLNLLEARLNGLRDYFREHENEFPQHEIHRSIGELFFSALPIDDLGARLLNGDYIGREDHPTFYERIKHFHDAKYVKERSYIAIEKTGEPQETLGIDTCDVVTDEENYYTLGTATNMKDWHVIINKTLTQEEIDNHGYIFNFNDISVKIEEVNHAKCFILSVNTSEGVQRSQGNFIPVAGKYFFKLYYNGYRYIFDYTLEDEDSYITDSVIISNEVLESFDVVLNCGKYDLMKTYLANGKDYTYGAIPQKVECSYNFFCSNEEYQASLDKEGVCAKFVFADDYIRLPTISLIQGTSVLGELGDLGALGDIADDTGFQTGKYYLYICVGNMVKVNAEYTDGKSFVSPFSLFDIKLSSKEIVNGSWLLATHAFYNGDIYEGAYNELLRRYNNEDPHVRDETETYTEDDFVINRTEHSFKLPQKQYYIHDLIKHVTNSNGEYWLYSDGYVRMVGSNSGVHQNFITLPYEMPNTDYHVSITQEANNNLSTGDFAIYNRGTKGFNIRMTRYATWRQHNGANSDDLCDADKAYTHPIKFEVTGYVENTTKTYYYVGPMIQNASVINASQVLNEIAKLKKGIQLIKTFHQGPSWYRIWSDGWCEQGGRIGGTGSTSGGTGAGAVVTLNVPYSNTDYSITVSQSNNDHDHEGGSDAIRYDSITSTGFIIDKYVQASICRWEAKGYIDLTTINFESESIYGISNAQMDGIQRKLDALFEQMKEYMAVNSQLKVSESIPKEPDEDTLYVITDNTEGYTSNGNISELQEGFRSLKTQMELLRTQIKNNNVDNIIIPISDEESLEGTPVDHVEYTDDNGNTETYNLGDVVETE